MSWHILKNRTLVLSQPRLRVDCCDYFQVDINHRGSSTRVWEWETQFQNQFAILKAENIKEMVCLRYSSTIFVIKDCDKRLLCTLWLERSSRIWCRLLRSCLYRDIGNATLLETNVTTSLLFLCFTSGKVEIAVSSHKQGSVRANLS